MKVEISNRDFVVYLILITLIVFCVILWMKIDGIRLEGQVKINTQSIQNISNWINQVQQPPQPQQSQIKKKDEIK